MSHLVTTVATFLGNRVAGCSIISGIIAAPARSLEAISKLEDSMIGPQVPPRPSPTVNKHIPVRSPADRRNKPRQNVVKDRRAKVEPYSFLPLYVPCSFDGSCQVHPQQGDASRITVTSPATPSKTSDVLQSWKEISGYIKRSVRTCQRWERQAELPVHRPRPTKRSPVFSLPAELDLWMKHQRVRATTPDRRPTPSGVAVKHAVA